MKRLLPVIGLLLASILLVSCAPKNAIRSSAHVNPPPAEAFSAFGRFELKPVALAREFSAHAANQAAAAKIQTYFDERVKPAVDEWNARGAPGGRTLTIEPVIEQIRFIRTAARIFSGPFAGSSAVVMKVKYTDAASGKIVAQPEFYQHASAGAATMTYGGQDQAMLARIVTLVAEYNARNYDAPVGGPTGMPEDMQ
ncbi:MAG: hypothetical protein LBS70_08955 [Candidatus Accumulibacter sp.]|jgi:hypothetical protein|nr:hypothetical protein [Accumulibacter sp.]